MFLCLIYLEKSMETSFMRDAEFCVFVIPKDLKRSKLKYIVQKLVETCQHIPISSGAPVSVQCVLVPKRPIKRVRAS